METEARTRSQQLKLATPLLLACSTSISMETDVRSVQTRQSLLFFFFLINPFWIFHFQIRLVPELQIESHWKCKEEQPTYLHESVHVCVCLCMCMCGTLTWIFKVVTNLL